MEDRKNAKQDILNGDVRSILLIEDSPRMYSILLPLIYKEIIFHIKNVINLISDIKKVYSNYKNLNTKILAASIRSTKHITQVAMAGADVATVPPKLIEEMFNHPLTTKGLKIFLDDWKKTKQKIL